MASERSFCPRIRTAIMLTAPTPTNSSGTEFDSGIEVVPGPGVGCFGGFRFQQAGSRIDQIELHDVGEAYAEALDRRMITARDFISMFYLNPS